MLNLMAKVKAIAGTVVNSPLVPFIPFEQLPWGISVPFTALQQSMKE